jgi:hypothetical protein
MTLSSATVILVGLGVAIYYIIDDAIDKKVEDCLTKHFYTEKLFEKLNFTSPKDPTKINYSKEDCQGIVTEARRRTVAAIKHMKNVSECVKGTFEEKFVDMMLLKSALDKKNRQEDGSKVLAGILPLAIKNCNETMPAPN